MAHGSTIYNSWDYYPYTARDSTQFALRMDYAKAVINGASPTNTLPKWGKVSRLNRPRGVWGEYVTGVAGFVQKAFVPCCTQDIQNSIVSAGSFTLASSGASNPFTVTGYTGEQRSL